MTAYARTPCRLASRVSQNGLLLPPATTILVQDIYAAYARTPCRFASRVSQNGLLLARRASAQF